MAKVQSLRSDGAWLAGLQGLAALGQLAGVRLLTEVLSPSIFGEFSLWLGVAMLLAVGVANPTMQALLRYYPEYLIKERGDLARAVARQQLVKLMYRMLPLYFVIAITAIYYGTFDLTIIILLLLFVVLEVVRTENTTFLNAIRAQRLAGIWAVAESWGRPLLAASLIYLVGSSVPVVLAGYVLASLIIWFVMRTYVPPIKQVSSSADERKRINERYWCYTIPLLPLGLIGWIAGMADRYMIGALLSTAEVGLYVAIYGLASRPMLTFGMVVESVIRPAYLSALVSGERRLANRYLYKWTMLISVGSILAIVISFTLHSFLAQLLLGNQYHKVSYLLPWIVIGYSLLILSYIANRVCYANESTRSILFIESIGAVLAMVVGYIFIVLYGLQGAAAATIVYFGVQNIVALLLARRCSAKKS